MFVALVLLYYIASRMTQPSGVPIEEPPAYCATSSHAFLGPTRTAGAPFLAQTNTASPKTGTHTLIYTPPQPIETGVQSKDHKPTDRNIYELFGTISPYYVSDGFGVFEYGLPGQCKVAQVHVVSRHGTRYNTHDLRLPEVISSADFKAFEELEFLNGWKYDQGVNILTSLGNQQLFDKGVRTFFRYGRLLSGKDKIVARSTTQERMMMSAEYFLLGFFGTVWPEFVDLDLLIEEEGYNNSLASYDNCPYNARLKHNREDLRPFLEQYLAGAVERINSKVHGINFTVDDVYDMQELCTFEAVTLGFSRFCNLFTQKEWEDYEYYQSWNWYNENFLGSETARALGISWVEEFKNRLLGKPYNASRNGIQNSTLNEDPKHFPLNQPIYMDFTHDSVVTNIFSALNFQQFKSNFSVSGDKQPFDISKVVPFASQTYFEVIECDGPVPGDRSAEVSGNSKAKYIHVMLNDHTLPLAKNIPQYCEERADGWCDFNKFTEYLETLWDEVSFEATCFK